MAGTPPHGLTHHMTAVAGAGTGRGRMSRARTAVLFLAVVLAGILAGFFLTYAFTIMPGLETTDDRTFVEAFQGLERMFGSFDHGYNWPVLLGFAGGFLVTIAAIVLHRRRPIVKWLVAALVLYVATVAVTGAVNVPLNDEITAAGDAAGIDAARVRADFREDRWRAWNLVRTATSLGAFACLCWALFLHGSRRQGLDPGQASELETPEVSLRPPHPGTAAG